MYQEIDFLMAIFFSENDGSGGESEGSEVSSAHSEEKMLEWVAALRLVPMYCLREGEGEGAEDVCNIDGIIEALKVHTCMYVCIIICTCASNAHICVCT